MWVHAELLYYTRTIRDALDACVATQTSSRTSPQHARSREARWISHWWRSVGPLSRRAVTDVAAAIVVVDSCKASQARSSNRVLVDGVGRIDINDLGIVIGIKINYLGIVVVVSIVVWPCGGLQRTPTGAISDRATVTRLTWCWGLWWRWCCSTRVTNNIVVPSPRGKIRAKCGKQCASPTSDVKLPGENSAQVAKERRPWHEKVNHDKLCPVCPLRRYWKRQAKDSCHASGLNVLHHHLCCCARTNWTRVSRREADALVQLVEGVERA